MNVSLTIAGIELGIVTPPGPLERLVAARYAPFLGAVLHPVCTVRLAPRSGTGATAGPPSPLATMERTGGAGWTVSQPGFSGAFDAAGASDLDCAVSPLALDDCLKWVFSLLGSRHRALLLRASGVIGVRGAAHVFVGGADTAAMRPGLTELAAGQPMFNDGHVMVRRLPSGAWSAAATPFCHDYGVAGPPRESRLARLWLGAGAALAEHVLLACPDEETRSEVRFLIDELVRAVPVEALEAPLSPSAWREVDATVA